MNVGSNNVAPSSKRVEQLQFTYRAFLAGLFLVLLVILSSIYFAVAGISINNNLHSLPLHIEFGLFAVIGAAILITSISSGLLWARFAKKFLAVTEQEMRAVFIKMSPHPGQLDPKTEKGIKSLYP